MALCLIGIFRIYYFDLLISNPTSYLNNISGITLFNTMLLPFGFSLLWIYFLIKSLESINLEKLKFYVTASILPIIFALISYNVKFFFQGSQMQFNVASNAEIYSYSVAWLLLGVVMLFIGTLKDKKIIRYASLGIIILAIGKVFIYDASELEGLYRVFSFLGLGVSLIALSWFYSRFVFIKTQ